MKKNLSVIICTYNRAELLRRLLHALAGQTLAHENFEVIVIDDGSTDSTPDVCRAAMEDRPNIRYVSAGKNTGLGSAANLGARTATGEFLIFIDDDCIPREDWAEKMSLALVEHPLVAGCVTTPTSNFIKLCHNIAEFHPFLPGRVAGNINFIAGANMGIRRALYNEVQGFPDGHVLSPDMQFILKAREMGYAIYFEPGSKVIHDHERRSFSEIFRYAAMHAAETILLRRRYRKLLQTPFFMLTPGLLAVTAPVIAAKVTAGIYLGNPRNMKYILTAPIVYALKLAWCWGAARSLKRNGKIGVGIAYEQAG